MLAAVTSAVDKKSELEMRHLDRRAFAGGLAGFALLGAAPAQAREELSLDADEEPMALTRFAANASNKRPCVLVLHGSRAIELKPRAYERYAEALMAEGIDTYFLRYLTAADALALDPKASTKSSREAYDSRRYADWAKRVSSVMTAVLARPDSSGRLGLLGFSLGGYVASLTAAEDDRVSALAVLYAGLPDDRVAQVKHLPPLIELHGDADSNVPLAKGRELVGLAQTFGVKAEIVTYPGKEHGFDFSDTDPMTSDAIRRVVQFFRSQLRRS